MSLKSYFVRRTGRALAWSFRAGSTRFGEADRRDYAITVRGVDDDKLIATVTSQDFDKDGKRLNQAPRDHGIAMVPMKGLTSPVEALEDAARLVDPKYFLRHPPAPRNDGAVADAIVEQRLKALQVPEGLAEGDPPPHPVSVQRFRTFWQSISGLVPPDLFSSKDGTLRARWMDGDVRTLWVNFPEKGALGWSVQVPRQGGYGLRKLNARCADEQDIIPMAQLLGVKCLR